MTVAISTLSSLIVGFLIVIPSIFYAYVKYVYTYWERRGVKHLKPKFPLGNFADFFLQRVSIGELVEKMYYQTKDPFVGIYGAIRPTLLLRDPALVRRILIKDFQHFADRGVYIDEVRDPLSGNLFSLYGEKWRNLRASLTPVFTSGKLKAMFSTLLDCGVPLKRYLSREAEQGNVVEMREIAARYTTNIIGANFHFERHRNDKPVALSSQNWRCSTSFGIDVNTIDNPDLPFRTLGRKAFAPTFMNGVRSFMRFVYPKMQNIFRVKFVDKDIEEFMINLVKDTMEYREKNKISRKDLLQLMIQLRNTGNVHKDDVWDTAIADEKDKNLTVNEIAAQAWVFYAAGFETSSSTMSFCLYELASNMDIQRKVQEEIDEVTARHNGEITYDSIMEMKYLEMCIQETLRKYPVVPILHRECTRDYTIPDTNVNIEKGTAVIIPVLALHRDARFFPEPEKFIPERFHSNDYKPFEERPHLGFGDGPRGCIGLRMGKMQTKVGLVFMLQDFTYNLVDKNELKLSAKSFLVQPTSGINLTITQRVR